MIRFSCLLIGWDWNILKKCTASSHSVVKKYATALILIMAIWLFIGYNFASKYFGLGYLGSFATGIAFACLILGVERVIILSSKSKLIGLIRLLMAICMASIGATIIDQILFQKDIEQGKIQYITEKVNAERDKYLNLIKIEQNNIQNDIDSLTRVNINLSEEINKRPMIRITNYTEQVIGETDSLGNVKKEKIYSTSQIENPKNNDLRRNQSRIDVLQKKKDDLFKESQTKEDELRKQYEENFGLLVELEVMFSVVLNNTLSIILYCIIFVFFLFVELLVVITKMLDNHQCDYEVLIEKQNAIRITEIQTILEMNEKNQ